MITAALQGRDLAITVEGIESPFVIRPLPGRMGKQLTHEYLLTLDRQLPATRMEEILMISVDGGQWVAGEDGDVLMPLDPADRTVYNRCDDELSTTEAQDVLHPAFFWQTVLGMDGINVYIKGGGGYAGGLKALGSLAQALGMSPLMTSLSSESATLTPSPASTSPTSTPTAGSTVERLPAAKRSRNQGGKKKRR